jgi:hypothetical protein
VAVTNFPIGTLILPEPARTETWHRWRAQLDLDQISYECQQTLPALAPCLPLWLEADSCAARINGIVKMAWSRNQVRLYKAAELQKTLLEKSVTPVVIAGPLGWSLLTREEGSIRTIPDLTMLIPRHHVFNSVAALTDQGWKLHSPCPDSDTLDWSSNLAFTRDDATVHLHWRLFPTSARKAIRFEDVFLQGLRPVSWNGCEFQALSPEADLLHRLTDRPPWDPVPWQADVLMMSLADIDWSRLAKLAARFAFFFQHVDVLGRLMELRRDWDLPIPEMASLTDRSGAIATTPTDNRWRFAKLRTWGRSLWRA